MAIAPQRSEIGIRRHFTTAGVHPYDEVVWERRDARITNYRDGSVAFEQLGVEVPESWSVNATNILAQKYFRGTLGHRRARVVAQAGGRPGGRHADAVGDQGRLLRRRRRGPGLQPRAEVPHHPPEGGLQLAGVVQHRRARRAGSKRAACFILSVEDTMDSILNWYTEEGVIFKGGSGAGVNLSRIRSSQELLKGGGTASGPVSFMRGADASAGTIKSGGKTRRAAKMVILDADHPDVEDFIWCKAIEERKARVLRDAGFDMDLDGVDSHSTQYQNANNSVRVTDEFMQAVIDGRDWDLTARTDGSVVRTVPARDLFRQIAHSAWECADPGLQYDTTINRWHTAPMTGRINGSNPCFPGSAKVHTDKGLIPFSELFRRANEGETFGIYTHDATNADEPSEQMWITSPEAFMITGYNDIVRLRLDNGVELRCTPGHKIFTTNRGYVEARHLTFRDEVKLLDLEAPAVDADLGLPVSSDPDDYWTKGDHGQPLRFPETWSEEFAHYLGWLVGDGSTSGTTVAAIYGSQEDREEILPRHAELLDWVNCERPIKLSEQANGTVQLRLARRAFKQFIEALGVKSVKGPEKTVPWSIERAPAEMVAAFLRGLYDADGCVVSTVAGSGKSNYVGLGSASPELLRGVQTLLSTFGIMSRLYQTRSAAEEGSFEYTNKAGETKRYGHSGGVRPPHFFGVNRHLRPAHRVLAEPQSGSSPECRRRRPSRSVHLPQDGAPARANQRRGRADLQPDRAPQPLVRGERGSCTQLLGIRSPRQLSLQSGVHESAHVPRRQRRVRRRGLQGGGGRGVHGPGDHGGQRRLPDGEDRRDHAGVPPARHRLRQPGRAAHGPGAALRLGFRPGLGGRHHGLADGPRLRHVGPDGGAHGAVRRLPREPARHAQRAAHAPVRGGQHRRGRGAAGAALGGAGGVGPGGRPGRGLRRAQLAGQCFGADGNHCPC